MTLPRRAHKAVAAAFALTLLAAACGGDDSSSDDPPETTASTAPADDSTTTTGDDEETKGSTEPEDEGPDEEAALALAESLNLTRDDLSSGWEEEPADDDDGDELGECFQDVDIDAVEVAQADSPSFSIATDDGAKGQVVQTTAIVVDEESSAEDVIAEIGTNRFAGCAEDALIASFEEDGGQITASTIDVVEDQGGLGDEAIGLAGDITFDPGNGTEYSGQLAFYFIRTQNVVSGVQVFDIGDVAFEDTLAEILALVAQRHGENI